MANRVVHFEIQADNIERAADFYRTIFGWKIEKWESGTITYWMVTTGDTKEPGGINGGIIQRPHPAPAPQQGTNAFVCTVQVDSFDAYAQKILAHGGTEAMPKFAIPGMAWQGYFIDSEGNTFGLHEADPHAQ